MTYRIGALVRQCCVLNNYSEQDLRAVEILCSVCPHLVDHLIVTDHLQELRCLLTFSKGEILVLSPLHHPHPRSPLHLLLPLPHPHLH